MAGPPLALSSSTNTNANVRKDGNRDDEPCPKRRRKSIDEPVDVPDGTPSSAPPATRAAAGAQQDGASAPDKEGADPGAGVVGDGDANSAANGDDVPNPLAAKGDDDGASGDGTRPEGGDRGEAGAGSAAVDTNLNAGVAHAERVGRTEGPTEEEEEEEEEDNQGGEEEEDEEEDEEEEGEGESGESPRSSTPGEKPDGSKIARARSAWMLFLADNREKVRKEHPGLAVGPMQKILSEMWKALGEEEVSRYAKLAAEDKERMKSELAAAGLTKLPSKNSNASASVPGGPTSLVLPLARVRKTVRLDPAVGNISKEGLLLVTKATEVFMAFVADHAWKIGRQTGRKSVRPCDVADFVFTSPEMYWLKDEFRDERSSVKKQSKPEASGAKGAGAGRTGVVAVPKAANPITSFFKKA